VTAVFTLINARPTRTPPTRAAARQGDFASRQANPDQHANRDTHHPGKESMHGLAH
jgi:hypothetical protein